MRFSERIGKKKVKCDIQLESMDADLRNGLWNIVYLYIFDKCDVDYKDCIKTNSFQDVDWPTFFQRLWHRFYKLPVDEVSYIYSIMLKDVRDRFFDSDVWGVYDFIDYIGQAKGPYDADRFRESCNFVLEKELSGYRFVGGKLTPVTDKVEINEIEEALERAGKQRLMGERKHLESAIDKLSNRENPDYRNSIKESISAVESLCIIISKDPKASLGKALKLIEDAVGLHPALKSGFSSIYGYTSDEGGIRHAMIEDNPCDFDDAKYMLVSCSAFVNYLIMKTSKAGLIK
ncbi:hypothetical protein ES703_91477 [subsurface metagenome]